MTTPGRIALGTALLTWALAVSIRPAPATAQAGDYTFTPHRPTAQAWETAGEKVNPAGTPVLPVVLAETAPFAAAAVQERRAEVLNRSAAPIAVRFEWRNAANADTRRSWLFVVPAHFTASVGLPRVLVAQGERFRLVLPQGVTGTVQGHLIGP